MKLAKIEAKLLKLQPTWVGEKAIASITRGLNAAFTKSIVHFTSSRYDSAYFKNYSIIVSGQYNPRILSTIPEAIQINLCFPKDAKKVKISEKEAKMLVTRIARAIHHEYRHKHQQKGRGWVYTKQYKPKFKKNRMKAMYYGLPDEIDAHAYETQAEKVNINKLRSAHKIGWRECEAIYLYRVCFRQSDPKVWKKFFKKVYKNNGNQKETTDAF
jgi:hypothetical protein